MCKVNSFYPLAFHAIHGAIQWKLRCGSSNEDHSMRCATTFYMTSCHVLLDMTSINYDFCVQPTHQHLLETNKVTIIFFFSLSGQHLTLDFNGEKMDGKQYMGYCKKYQPFSCHNLFILSQMPKIQNLYLVNLIIIIFFIFSNLKKLFQCQCH